jgi:para-aminobenzoate synthetase
MTVPPDEQLVSAIRQRLAVGPPPILVALDGASGSGKTTLAAAIATQLDAVVVPSDDFYSAHVTRAEWDALDPVGRAEGAIHWRRLRHEALEPLLARRSARWRRFDFEAGEQEDGRYPMRGDFSVLQPAPIILCDGAYSARPELADLVDLSVLVDVPVEVRHARLAEREAPDTLRSWHERWDAAEIHYFTNVRPKNAFDLVVTNADRR